MNNEQPETKEQKYPQCKGTDCGVEIINIVGGHFYVTLETPWGEPVKTGPFCGECAVKLAMLGVHLHDIDAIHKELGLERPDAAKKREPLQWMISRTRNAAVAMIRAAPDLAEGVDARGMAAASLLAAMTMCSHEMNERDIREGVEATLLATKALREMRQGQS